MSGGFRGRCWGVVPAAGVGRRMGGVQPKQYLELAGQTILQRSLACLLDSGVFEAVVVAVAESDDRWRALPAFGDPRVETTQGGAERADSVLSALRHLVGRATAGDWVLVHDAARPLLRPATIRRLVKALATDPTGGILAQPVHDTLKSVNAGQIEGTLDRSRIWRAQTPQMFRYSLLLEALSSAVAAGAAVTDEASAVERLGLRPRIVEGPSDNLKITRPEDLPLAAFYLEHPCSE